jgi:hypothetical protein
MQVEVSLKSELPATAGREEMEEQIQEAGHQAMREALKQAIRHWEEQRASCPHCGEQPMLVGLDGGWVCSRGQRGGMEGKVAVVCSAVEDLPMPTYDPTFSWSKTEQARHFPQATCILDWAHLWREVSRAIHAAARAKPLSEQERDCHLYRHRSWLWHGQVDLALQGLRKLATGLEAQARKTIQKAITYLEKQRRWIGSYEDWRKLGYPVGSGMIERAVALVINRRMKKRGMRWKRTNGTAVVALRTDLLNEDWITPQRLRAFP